MKRTLKTAVNITVRSAFVLFLYRLIFLAVKKFLLSPAAGFLWGLALKTTPSSFISSSNIFDLLKNPVCIVIGLLILIVYAFVSVWEIFGILTGLEYAFEERNISVFNLFRANFFQTKHMFKPKNWPFVFLCAALLPIIDILNTDGKLAGFSIPEYIMLVVRNTPFLMILYVLVFVGLFFLVLHLMYGFYTFVTEKKDANEAVKTGCRLIQHHKFSTILVLFAAELICVLLFTTLPGILVSLVKSLLGLFFSNNLAYAAAANLCFERVLLTVLEFLSGFLSMLGLMSVNLTLYHRYMEKASIEETLLDERFSSKMGVKRKHDIRTFPILVGILLPLTIILTVICTVVLTQSKDAAAFLDKQFRIDIIAHRGFDEKAPENTMPAFQLTADSDICDIAELDVTPSKEGIPIVMHDLSAKRTTGVDKNIRDMTLEEIQALDAGSHFHSKFKGTKVPTLEDVILFAKENSLKLLIEIKNTDDCPEFEKTVVDMIHAYDFQDMCMIQSLSYESLLRVKDFDPSLSCGYIMAIASGAFLDLPAADFFSIEHTFVNRALVKRAEERGKKIYTWTMNDEKFIREMGDAGVFGMIGDDPDEIYSVYMENLQGVRDYVKDRYSSILPADDNVSETGADLQSVDTILEGA